MRSSRPRYDPRHVERLAREGRVVATRRVVQWLVNHDYDAAATLAGVLGDLSRAGRWTGSTRLINNAVADEYIATHDGEGWYVKFSVGEDPPAVTVWSCCWSGAVH